MPVAADSENLQVNAPRILNLLLVQPAVSIKIKRPAIRDVRVVGFDIDVRKEIVVHEEPVALRVRRTQPHVFIQVERRHLGKVQPLFPVQANQFLVKQQRRTARRHPQHAVRFLADKFRNKTGRSARGGLGIGFDDDAHAKTLLQFQDHTCPTS